MRLFNLGFLIKHLLLVSLNIHQNQTSGSFQCLWKLSIASGSLQLLLDTSITISKEASLPAHRRLLPARLELPLPLDSRVSKYSKVVNTKLNLEL